jgi:hypothetical protein
MTLYKYLIPDRADILELEHIRYTQPAYLNDPFEMRPNFRELFSEKEMATQFRRQAFNTVFKELRDKLPEGKRALGYVIASIAMIVMWRRMMETMRTVADTLSNKFRQDFEKVVEEKLRHSVGVLSLTQRDDNLLMWSHYADQHRGFVLAIDEMHPVFSQRRSDEDEFNYLREVQYSIQRQRAELKLMGGVDLLLLKSTEWAHEEEWRIVRSLDDASAVALNPSDHTVHLFSLPPDAIKGVIYGAHIADEHRQRIQNILYAKPEYDHVWQMQAEVASERFGLNFFKLPGVPMISPVQAVKIISHDVPNDLREDIVALISRMITTASQQPLDLSRLRTVHVAPDIRVLLDMLEGAPTGPTDAHVLAFAAGDECDVDMFLSISHFKLVTTATADEQEAMTHFLHKEMAHVHNVTVRYRALGEKALTTRPNGKNGYLGPVAMCIWNDYAVARLSASTASHALRLQYGKKVKDNLVPCQIAVESEIKAYRTHGDLNRLMNVVMEQLVIYLGAVAEGLGYADGGDPMFKDAMVDLVMAGVGSEYAPIARDMHAAFKRMYRYYPAWEDFTIYDGLMFAARHLAFQWGVSLRDKGKLVHIAIP